MKKENRKMAQERRAKERRKKEIQRNISRALVIGIPIMAAVILFAAIIISALTADDSSADASGADASSDTQTETASSPSADTSDTSAELLTDASLTVEDGDTVNIDYVGSIDGVEFDGGNTNGQGTDLIIGSDSYIDDFEDQLIGTHPGDEVDVYVTFPDDYSLNPDLSGKEALFEVTVNGIYE